MVLIYTATIKTTVSIAVEPPKEAKASGEIKMFYLITRAARSRVGIPKAWEVVEEDLRSVDIKLITRKPALFTRAIDHLVQADKDQQMRGELGLARKKLARKPSVVFRANEKAVKGVLKLIEKSQD